MTPGAKTLRVVVGIDFGTSRSGYAYAFIHEKKIYGRLEWPAAPDRYIKTLTQSLYAQDNTLAAWGYEARRRLAHLRNDRSARAFFHLQRFKMALRESTLLTANGPEVEERGRRFLVLDLISDFLREIKKFALADLQGNKVSEVAEREILWCLTVPAIWSDAEKQLMRKAAVRAGLIGAEDHEAERLLLVLEPEAAAVYCQEKERLNFKPGSRFMVVDCGGGTVDITAHEIVHDGQMREIAPGTGGKYGSTYVDRNFIAYFASRLSPEAIKAFQEEFPVDYLDMMEDWERAKCGFDPETSGEAVYLPFRSRLSKLLSSRFKTVLERLAAEQDGDDDRVVIRAAEMEQLFRPVIDGTLAEAEKQWHSFGPKGCDYLFLVGGFSSSPLLRREVERRFAGRIKKVVYPPSPGAAIVEGAVALGIEPELIRERRSRLTYGCAVDSLFREGVDPESKKYWAEDQNAYYCRDRFTTFVEAGQALALDQAVHHSFFPLKKAQTEIGFRFFASTTRNIQYADQPGLSQIGSLTVRSPRTDLGLNRTIDLTLYFGRSELRAVAVDKASGQRMEIRLDFSWTLGSST